jgi:hypothetical protein
MKDTHRPRLRFRAATLMALKRALRNRFVLVPHSLSRRAPEDKLIPLKLWQRSRGRFIRDLNLPAGAETSGHRHAREERLGGVAGLALSGHFGAQVGDHAISTAAFGAIERFIRPADHLFDRAIRGLLDGKPYADGHFYHPISE